MQMLSFWQIWRPILVPVAGTAYGVLIGAYRYTHVHRYAGAQVYYLEHRYTGMIEFVD